MRKRKAREGIEVQKRELINALYSNPNWDDKEANREEYVKELEEKFDHAVRLIYNPDLDKGDEQEIDWDNPFWAASKRAQERIFAARPELRDKTVGEGMKVEMDEDQLEARARSRREIDQVSMASR